MPGAGVQNNLVGTRLTPREDVRIVATADTDVFDIEEIIDTRLNESGNPDLRGDGQTLALFIILVGGASGATLKLYADGGDDLAPGESLSSSSLGDEAWCLVDVAFAITEDTLKIFNDMPAGRYKVMVTSITGGSGDRVIIKEQHSA